MKVFSKKVFLGSLVAVVGCLMATTSRSLLSDGHHAVIGR